MVVTALRSRPTGEDPASSVAAAAMDTFARFNQLIGLDAAGLMRGQLRLMLTEPELRRITFERRMRVEDAAWTALRERGVAAEDLAAHAAVTTVVSLTFLALVMWATADDEEPLVAVLARCLLAAPHPARLATGTTAAPCGGLNDRRPQTSCSGPQLLCTVTVTHGRRSDDAAREEGACLPCHCRAPTLLSSRPRRVLAGLVACGDDELLDERRQCCATDHRGDAGADDAGDGVPSELRDVRYCEVIPSVSDGTTMTTYVYNTLGLNFCPPDLWRALTEDQVNQEFGSQQAKLNGRRHWVLDSIQGSGSSTTGQTFNFGGIDASLRGTLSAPADQPTVARRSSRRQLPAGRGLHRSRAAAAGASSQPDARPQSAPALHLSRCGRGPAGRRRPGR